MADILKFGASLNGKVNNYRLSSKKCLFPLFEAIANSIYAIKQLTLELGHSYPGIIDIEIVREPGLFGEEFGLISGFKIKDNGIGFNALNMNSFMTFDSMLKEKEGGKGNGRFSWLKMFGDVQIESIFKEDDVFYKRSFSFNLSGNELLDVLSDTNERASSSIVFLKDAQEPYKSKIPNSSEEISKRIADHFVVNLINDDCPTITINDLSKKICINELFRKDCHQEHSKETFTINGSEFTLHHLKMKNPEFGFNKIYYCANERLVDERKLENFIPDLDSSIFEKEKYWYLAVLEGDYLDKNVDSSRQSFNIEEEGENLLGDISKQKINKEAFSRIKMFLSEYLQQTESEKEQRIKAYVHDEAPEYKALLKYKLDEIKKIKPGATGFELEDNLSKIKRDFENETKKECDELVNKIDTNVISVEEYQKEFDLIISKVSEMNQSLLANYVAKRKLVLKLFKKGLEMKKNGKFEVESYMHSLIYPMNHNSTDNPYDNHNLWLIDEKLSYSVYISSDIPFNNDRHEKRPDIMILNNPVAMADSSNDGTVFANITLFELKRPDRDDYTPEDNPVDQLLGYVERIKNGDIRDAGGRIIRVNDNTQFFLYIIADVTPTLKKILERKDFKFFDDDTAFYHFSNYKAHAEVLSYDRILRDAEKRNKIFFSKLGI